MAIDIVIYRIFRLWRVIVLGILPSLATVWLASLYHSESFPILTLVAIIVPTAHVLRYPNNWTKTVAVSLILSICIALAATNSPDLAADEVAIRVIWLAILALILFFVFVTPITMLFSSGPLINIRAAATRRSKLDGRTLKKAITIYPGRIDERTICGEADETGLFPVAVQMKFDTVQYKIEDCGPTCDVEDRATEETGIAKYCYHAVVHSSGPDHHEVFTYADECGAVGATRYEFRDIGGRATNVSIEETGTSFPWGEAFGFWLTGQMADFLTDEIDRAEGRPRRANRAFAHKQLVVDLANILLLLLGGRRVDKTSV